MKKFSFSLIFMFSFVLFAQDDGFIELEFNNDSLTIWHYGAWRNCGAIYTMEIETVDSTIYLMEKDTSSMWANCMCYFDLATSVTMPDPGRYRLIVRSTDILIEDTILVADTSFSVNQVQVLSFSDPECMNILGKNTTTTEAGVEIPVIDHYVSDCQSNAINNFYVFPHTNELVLTWYVDSINCYIEPVWQANLTGDTLYISVEDTNPTENCLCPKYFTVTFGPIPAGKYILDFRNAEFGYPKFIIDEQIILETEGNDLILNWDVADLNCCLETLWEGWLDGNIFHVTMTDTGAPCDCLCPFELSVRFGPFAPGIYTLDFENTYLAGPFEFTIQGIRKQSATITILSYYQSECYDAVQTKKEPTVAQDYAVISSYPNPFNPVATIEFYLPIKTDVSIKIYNITGALVHEIFSGNLDPGKYFQIWDAADFSSGIYFIQLNGKNIHLTNKLLLMK